MKLQRRLGVGGFVFGVLLLAGCSLDLGALQAGLDGGGIDGGGIDGGGLDGGIDAGIDAAPVTCVPMCDTTDVCVDTGTGFSCEPMSECTNEEDCPGGSCIEGACVLGCSLDAPCASPEVCVERLCVECETGLDCSAGLRCVANRCVECESDSHCGDGVCDTESNVCLRGPCEQCMTNAECEEATACVLVNGDVRCAPLADFAGECPRGFPVPAERTDAAGTPRGVCLPWSEATCVAYLNTVMETGCVTDADCGSRGKCGSGDRCTYECNIDLHCPTGFDCGDAPRLCEPL